MSEKPSYEELTKRVQELEQAELQHRQVEEKLRESEEWFRQVVENVREVFWLRDRHTGRILYISPAYETIWGRTVEEMYRKGPSFMENVHPEDKERVSVSHKAMYEEDRPFDEEYRMIRPDHSIRWVRTRCYPVFNQNGEVTRYACVAEDITERKKSEEALRGSEDRYRLLADNTLDVIWTMNLDLEFTYVNPACFNLTGYTPEEWIGSRLQEHCDEENFAKMVQVIADEMAKGPESSGVILEAVMLKKNREPILFEIHGKVIYDDNDQPTSLQGITHDISERKRMEEALRKSEDWLQSILRVAPTGIGVVRDRILLEVNPHLCEMTGYKKEDLIGKSARILYATQEDFEYVGREKYRQIAKRGSGTVETRFQRKDGSIINVLLASTPMNPSDLSKGVTFTALDITERKKAEEALKQSERSFAALAENANDGIIVAGNNGAFLYANRNASEITGYSVDELCKIGTKELAHPNEVPRLIENLKRRLEGEDVPKQYETAIVHKQGKVVPVEITAAKTSWHGYAADLIVLRDIAERKRAEEEREKLHDQLFQAQKMESVGRLAGGVAHDFNNMLGVILGRAEMILIGMQPEDPFYADLKEIQKAGKRSADLTRQLLAFARKQTIAPKVLNLNDTVEGMLKMLRRLIGEDINLLWKPDAHLWPVKMDAAQMDQILTNLCVNARGAIAGTGNIAIETENVVLDEAFCAAHEGFIPGEYVMLSVSDDGCGMDEATQAQIFEPFFTTKGVGEGTGLGSATVYGIVKQNNGFINVYSEVGKGTTFKIYIPRHEGAIVKETATDSTETLKGHGETILLVEDDPSILNMGKTMLERLGYTVLAAEDSSQVLNLAKEHKGQIHLLMTDVVMPTDERKRPGPADKNPES